MIDGGSLLIMIYYGVEWVIFYYNVMGVVKVVLEVSVRYLVEDFGKDNICVNLILVGVIKMLVVVGIGDFCFMLKWSEYNLLLCCIIMFDDVVKFVFYLFSDFGSGVIGEVLYVDCGYYVMGMKVFDVLDIFFNKDV